MTNRYTGGIISATAPTVSQSSASGVWNLEEAQYYQKAGLWPDGSGADPYFRNNVLLLHGDGTNGAQNNTFLDSSTNNFTITRNGNTTQGSFNPYVGPGCWSAYFNGASGVQWNNGGRVTVSSTATFTIEAWVYLPATPGAPAPILADGQNNTATFNWSFQINTDRTVRFNWYSGVSVACASTGTVSLNTWTHVAISVASGAIKLFINGQLQTLTGTTTLGNPSSTAFMQSGTQGTGPANYMTGHISNLRLVNNVALYSATFTPSTTPLIATTNTTLLAFQSNNFNDLSASNAGATSILSAPQISKFSPFTFYQTTPASYSGYFDGTGDNATIPASPTLYLGASDFTVEAWVYLSGTQTTTFGYQVLGTYSGTANGYALVVNRSSGGPLGIIWANGTPTANKVTYGTYLNTSTWYHIAVVRAGSVLTIYLNGVAVATGTDTTNDTVLQTLYIGSQGAGQYFPGSISNVRITKGTAVYTANFTPSTSALTTTTTVPSNQSNSVSFDGTGDYLTVPAGSAFNLSTGDFCIEMWVYPIAQSLYGALLTFDAGDFPLMIQWASAGSSNIRFYAGSSSAWISGMPLTFGTTVLNSWQHLCVTRTSGVFRVFMNGILGATLSDATAIGDSSGSVYIGSNGTTGYASQTLISNLRIIKGSVPTTYQTSSTTVGATIFTPSTSPLTTTSQGATAANVSLLTCQDRMLEDNSLNLFAVTAAGDARPSSANPFVTTNGIGGTSYGGYFDGTSDYLTVPDNANLELGTSNFTIEMWVYVNAAAQATLLAHRATNITNGPLALFKDSSNVIKMYLATGAAGWDILNGPTVGTVTNGQWYHVSVCRSGSNFYGSLNGVVVSLGTSASSIGDVSSNWGIGADIDGGNSLNGFISNVRIIKGTALYTSSFSPSTTPLTAITNTQLLTCQNTTFIDNSTNAFIITANGNAITTPFNPFSGATTLLTCQSTTFIDNSAIPQTITANGNATPKRASPFTDTVTGPTPYAAAAYGGSAYFDGNGDYLTLPVSAALGFGTGNFTWEAWINPAQTSAYQSIYDTSAAGDTSATGRFLVDINAGGVLRLMTAAGTTTLLTSASGAIVANQWQHIAIARSGTTGYMFINGALVNTATVSTNFLAVTASGTNRPIIGAGGYAPPGAPYSGYMSNMRVINGTALYTTPFVPPAAPVTAITSTQLLLNGTNAGIFDNTTINDMETGGSAQVSTSVVKYGTGSMYFNGLNSYLITTATALPLGLFTNTSDWTIEFWFYTGTTTGTMGLFDTYYVNSPPYSGILVQIINGTINTYDGGSNRATTTTYANNTWYHFAWVNSGGTSKIYINGTNVTIGGVTSWTTPSNIYRANAPIQIGRDYAPNYFNGYIDDLRITKGYARYTANFTPPGAAFPNF